MVKNLLIALSLGVLSMTSKAEGSCPDCPVVRFETSLGNIDIEVLEKEAPVTAANFIEYVNSGYYDGTIFHRVIPGFVAQGGGFEPGMKQKKTNDPIENEADNGLKNARGSLSMARTNDPHSATSQFFINFVDNAFLDFSAKNPQGWGYAVFANVVEGMEVVDQMAQAPTGNSGMHSDVPQEDIILSKAYVLD